MTRPDIEAIKGRLAAATPGPWDHADTGGTRVDYAVRHMLDEKSAVRVATVHSTAPAGAPNEDSHANAALIANAPTDISACLEYIERLEAALRPFAEAAESALDGTDRDEWRTWEHAVSMDVTIADYRRAVAALKGETNVK